MVNARLTVRNGLLPHYELSSCQKGATAPLWTPPDFMHNTNTWHMKRKITVKKKDDPIAYRKAIYQKEKEETKRVNLTFSLSDYKRLESESSRANIRPTAYAKRAVMSVIDKRMKQSLPAPATLTMLVQTLRPIARNFNQLVRRANTYGANQAKLDQAEKTLRKMQHTVENALNSDNPINIEKQIIAYLYRDPKALNEVEQIIKNYKVETRR